MLSRLFHRWERRLAAATPDRVVRPFEWGLDWIPTNGRPPDTPRAILREWTRAALADTDRFFAVPPTTDYTVEPVRIGPPPRDPAERAVLFPSAYTSPHPTNNIVSTRYFPARGQKTRRARRAVLVLPQWNADETSHIGLCRLLSRFGISALRLTLPYHEGRMPSELHRADYVVSANVGRTLQACRQAVLDARRGIAWLAAEGYERIGILGTSLGSCLSLLTTAHEPLVRVQALNHVSLRFADVVWRGLSTAHVRQGLEGHIDLELLRELWAPISPSCYVNRIGDRPTLLIYARYDLSFPVELSRALVEEFRRHRVPHEVASLPCGHYSSALAPFKYLDGYHLVKFLARHLRQSRSAAGSAGVLTS